MTRLNRGLVALGAAVLLTSSALAGTSTGRLSQPNFMPNGVVVIYFEGTRAGVPSCATEYRRFAVNAATPQGKVQLAGLLTAYTQGKTVNIYGTNACTAWGDTETIDFFAIVD